MARAVERPRPNFASLWPIEAAESARMRYLEAKYPEAGIWLI